MPGSLTLLQGDPTEVPILPEHTTIGVNTSGQLFVRQADGTFEVITGSSPGFLQAETVSGSVTITIGQPVFLAILSILGGARSVPIILSTVNAVEGAQLEILLDWTDVAGIIARFNNGSGAGTLLNQYTSLGDGITQGSFRFYFDGESWQKLTTIIPA